MPGIPAAAAMRRAFRRIHSLDAEASSIDRPEAHGQPCRHARRRGYLQKFN